MENSNNVNHDAYHLLTGYLIDSQGKEALQIEYRFLESGGCEIYTQVKDRIFNAQGENFFGSLSDLLDTLPPSSSIVFNHTIPIKKGKRRELVSLEEWLYPYQVKNTGNVVYILKLTVDDIVYETKPTTDFGGTQILDGGALEQLQRLTQDKIDILVCWFCRLLVEYNEIGGTDYRHDQLFCFRGKQELLERINQAYPHLRGHEHILAQTIHNLSALHSCDAFERNLKPRS